MLSFLLLSLLINGCGSSNRATPTTRSATAATTAAPTTTASPPTTSAPAPAPRSHTATATGPTSPQPTRTTGASNVRLPATFVITAHGSLSPSTVSAPAGVTIQLTAVSGDGHAHQVVVRTAPPHPLAVPPGGRASAPLSGLANGRYQLEVDGAAAGALVIGAVPGP